MARLVPKPSKSVRRLGCTMGTHTPTPRYTNGLVRHRRTSPRVYLDQLKLDRGHSHSLGPFLPLLDVELDTLVFLERAKPTPLDRGIVDEDILCTVIRSDESEAFFAVEPFHSSLWHLLNFSHSNGCTINILEECNTKS